MSRETATRAAMAGSRLYRGPMASVNQIQVTFDCAEPARGARFWCEVLGYVVPPPPEGFATWDDFDRALPPEHPLTALDRDLILSELEELGLSPPAVDRRDGAALLAMLRSAREESHAAIPKVRLEWAAFRPAP